MVRFALAALAAFAVVSAPMVALAQRAPESRSRPRSVVTFTPGDIVGSPQGPGLDVVFAPPKTTFPTLVRVRTSFADELVRSTDAL